MINEETAALYLGRKFSYSVFSTSVKMQGSYNTLLKSVIKALKFLCSWAPNNTSESLITPVELWVHYWKRNSLTLCKEKHTAVFSKSSLSTTENNHVIFYFLVALTPCTEKTLWTVEFKYFFQIICWFNYLRLYNKPAQIWYRPHSLNSAMGSGLSCLLQLSLKTPNAVGWTFCLSRILATRLHG